MGPAGNGGVERLLEREHELDRVTVALRSARSGAGRLLLIEGNAGAGKTALLRAARLSADREGMAVLGARGGELERDVPFGVVRQLFDPLLARVPDSERSALMRGAASRAEAVLGQPQRDDPEAEGVLHGLYWLCANASELTPLLLAVDDAHWCDQPSLAWLRYLVRRIDDLPVLLIIAARSAEPGGESETLSELASDAPADRLRPAPLSETAVSELIRAELGDPDPTFAQACSTATGGNPFLVGELLRALREEGVQPSAHSAARVEAFGPEAVYTGMSARLDRFPPGAAELARAVALLGIGAELGQAAALAGLDREQAERAVDALVAAGILAPGRPLEFIHPIVRQAIYGQLSESERARGHARAASLLADSGASLDQLATQLLATEPRGDPETVATLSRAASAAMLRGASSAAIAYLRRALREPPPHEERARVLLDLGSAESRVVDPVAIEHLSEAAEVASDPLIRARACRRLGFVLILSGRLPEVEATYDRAIAAAEGAEPDFALEVEAELISAAQMGMMPPRMLPERFARFDRDKITGDTAGERMLLGVLAFEAVRRNEPAEVAARLAERALRGRPVAAEALLESGPQSLAWLTLMYCDQIELADRIVTEARDLAIRSGSRRGYLVFSMFRSFLAFRLGELQECEELATEATRIDGLHEHGLRLMGASAAIRARVESGDLDGADELLEMIGVKDQPADEVFLEETVYARSLLRQARGEMRRALDDLLAVGRRMLAAGSVGAGVYEWRSKAALMYAALGEHERALEMADEELRLAREFGTPRVVGLALRAAGLLRTGEERIALLQEAVDVLAESPARLEHARALVDLGAMLRRGGRRSDAREVLVRGRMLAFESGATPLANHATDELKATGARPRRVVLSGNAALTPSQRRIASLAASGLSNPEIAQALFVSRKTVEMHLSHAYRTLGISSREELESALAQA